MFLADVPSRLHFLSRSASASQAREFATRLGDLAFLDTTDIDDGNHFPERLLDSILEARVVVVFASKAYAERRFCRLELRLALAGGDDLASHVVIAIAEGSDAVLDALPAAVASKNWPSSEATDRLEALVRRTLTTSATSIRAKLAAKDARTLVEAFLEESKLPQARSLNGILCSFPQGAALQSIGASFVGRAETLRTIHRFLMESNGGAARLTSRIAAGGGFGKTRLAIEYLYRYAQHYPGGIFWLNAEASSIQAGFWRILSAIQPGVPDIVSMRKQGRNVRRELEIALRGLAQPALYVIDNIPESAPGEDAPLIADFCPASAAVTVIATSRQDPREEGVKTVSVDTLERGPAILLLTENVPGAGALSWADWSRIAAWVGDLPIALDLLNRSLAWNSISPQDLLRRVDVETTNAASDLDQLREALRGQVPRDAVRGISEAFSISFQKLPEPAKLAALVLGQLAPSPIPQEFMLALPGELSSPSVRIALRTRHFVVAPLEGLAFGTMHRLIAGFLRIVAGNSTLLLLSNASETLAKIMTPDRCRDPQHWPLMNLCRSHAEVLFILGATKDETALMSSHMGLLAATLASAQRDDAAASRLETRVLKIRTRLLGEEHPETLTVMNNLSLTFQHQGDYVQARQLGEHVVKLSTKALGPRDPRTLTFMNNLALTFRLAGDRVKARRLGEQVVEEMTQVLGEEHPNTLTATDNLGLTFHDEGDYARAVQLGMRALEARTRVLGDKHPDTLASMDNLASAFRSQGNYSEARRLGEHVLDVITRELGEKHPDTLATMGNLALTLRGQENFAEARRLNERVLELSKRVLGKSTQTRSPRWQIWL